MDVGGRMKSRNRITIQQTQRLTLTTSLATSMKILRSDAEGLSRYLDEQAAENPSLIVSRPVAVDWTPRWRSAFGIDGPQPETAATAPSLTSHVMTLVDRLRFQGRSLQIAEALVEALEPSGWLGRSLQLIAQQVGASMIEVEVVLAQLQAEAEPTGLFARSLSECLRLQAAEQGDLNSAMVAVLARLDLVGRGEIDRLAREAALDVDVVRARIRTLRGYDPKPGTRFQPLSAPVREPDLIAELGPQGWTLALNRSSLPALSLAEGKGKDRAAARDLIRLVENRNATLLTVGQEILSRQEAALNEGSGALVPMRMAEVAAAVGLHESTVSRVVAGAAVDTPQGIWWLRALFTGAVREGGPAAGALRDRLARLVAAEDSSAPLSDEDLAKALAAGGAPIARRTVAKYRAALKLPPAHRRRLRR
jgi:RNA polymerase sigma-54 factor